MAIALEYETTEIGYRDLAEKYGVSKGTLQRRATAENWPQRRESYLCQINAKIRAEIQAKQTREFARDYERLQKASERVGASVESGALECKDLDSAAATLIALAKAKEQLAGGTDDPEALAGSRMDPWDFIKEANVRYTAVVKIIGPDGE